MSWTTFLCRLRRTVGRKSTKDKIYTVRLCVEEMEARACPGNLLSCNGDGTLMNLGLDLTGAESSAAMPSILAGEVASPDADVLPESAYNQNEPRESVSNANLATQSERDEPPPSSQSAHSFTPDSIDSSFLDPFAYDPFQAWAGGAGKSGGGQSTPSSGAGHGQQADAGVGLTNPGNIPNDRASTGGIDPESQSSSSGGGGSSFSGTPGQAGQNGSVPAMNSGKALAGATAFPQISLSHTFRGHGLSLAGNGGASSSLASVAIGTPNYSMGPGANSKLTPGSNALTFSTSGDQGAARAAASGSTIDSVGRQARESGSPPTPASTNLPPNSSNLAPAQHHSSGSTSSSSAGTNLATQTSTGLGDRAGAANTHFEDPYTYSDHDHASYSFTLSATGADATGNFTLTETGSRSFTWQDNGVDSTDAWTFDDTATFTYTFSHVGQPTQTSNITQTVHQASGTASAPTGFDLDGFNQQQFYGSNSSHVTYTLTDNGSETDTFNETGTTTDNAGTSASFTITDVQTGTFSDSITGTDAIVGTSVSTSDTFTSSSGGSDNFSLTETGTMVTATGSSTFSLTDTALASQTQSDSGSDSSSGGVTSDTDTFNDGNSGTETSTLSVGGTNSAGGTTTTFSLSDGTTDSFSTHDGGTATVEAGAGGPTSSLTDSYLDSDSGSETLTVSITQTYVATGVQGTNSYSDTIASSFGDGDQGAIGDINGTENDGGTSTNSAHGSENVTFLSTGSITGGGTSLTYTENGSQTDTIDDGGGGTVSDTGADINPVVVTTAQETDDETGSASDTLTETGSFDDGQGFTGTFGSSDATSDSFTDHDGVNDTDNNGADSETDQFHDNDLGSETTSYHQAGTYSGNGFQITIIEIDSSTDHPSDQDSGSITDTSNGSNATEGGSDTIGGSDQGSASFSYTATGQSPTGSFSDHETVTGTYGNQGSAGALTSAGGTTSWATVTSQDGGTATLDYSSNDSSTASYNGDGTSTTTSTTLQSASATFGDNNVDGATIAADGTSTTTNDDTHTDSGQDSLTAHSATISTSSTASASYTSDVTNSGQYADTYENQNGVAQFTSSASGSSSDTEVSSVTYPPGPDSTGYTLTITGTAPDSFTYQAAGATAAGGATTYSNLHYHDDRTTRGDIVTSGVDSWTSDEMITDATGAGANFTTTITNIIGDSEGGIGGGVVGDDGSGGVVGTPPGQGGTNSTTTTTTNSSSPGAISLPAWLLGSLVSVQAGQTPSGNGGFASWWAGFKNDTYILVKNLGKVITDPFGDGDGSYKQMTPISQKQQEAMGRAPQSIGDLANGVGDVATLGTLGKVHEGLGTADMINKNSAAYNAGKYAAIVAGISVAGIKIATELHHPVPKFLGGFVKQELESLPKHIHAEFHTLLASELKIAGIDLPIGGVAGSSFVWERYFLANPGSQRAAFDAVLRTARTIDLFYGTRIVQAFWRNIIGFNFTLYP